jgi:hypothetical protein
VAQQTSGVTEAGAGVVIDADKDETAIAMEKVGNFAVKRRHIYGSGVNVSGAGVGSKGLLGCIV